MDERVKELETLLQRAIAESGHPDTCSRTVGFFTDESLCDCWVRDARAALSGAPREQESTDQEAPEARGARGPVGPPLDALSVDSRAAAAPEAGEAALAARGLCGRRFTADEREFYCLRMPHPEVPELHGQAPILRLPAESAPSPRPPEPEGGDS